MFREVVNPNADVLATNFSDGAIDILGPTAATISIGGRVINQSNRGISGALVTLTGASGATRAARSNSFGYYRFETVAAGETYVLTVADKRRVFNPATRILTVNEERDDINFIGDLRNNGLSSEPQ